MNLSTSGKAVSIILKCIVIIAAAIGTFLSAASGLGGFMTGSRVFMYFTIQSNIAVAVICLIGLILLLSKKPVKNVWFIIKFIGTVSITLTGAVFSFVLAPTLGELAWNAHNTLTHVVVPIAAIADFFVTGVYGSYKKRYVPLVLIPPFAYIIYAGIGFLSGWEFAKGNNYPYFFLNWGSPAGAFGFTDQLPYLGCVWWILIGVVLILLVGFIYRGIILLIQRRMAR